MFLKKALQTLFPTRPTGQTLIIIDMQPYFAAARDKECQRGVIREIQTAKQNGDGIILVAYRRPQDIADLTYGYVDEITDAIGDYPRCIGVPKKDDDGSNEVQGALTASAFGTEVLLCCGVNTGACVRVTAKGLACKYPNSAVVVIADACQDGNDQTKAIAGYSDISIKNLSLRNADRWLQATA
jgi:nicotinamidase-related amidase